MKIFTIIVTFNGEKWIKKCLQSVFQSTTSVNIIVIDNCSTDETTSIIILEFPDVILIKNKENLGFGKANNIGMRMAIDENADYVFLLNQDVWIEPKAIELLVYTSENNISFGILSPMHLTGSGNSLDFNFSNYLIDGCAKEIIEDNLFQKKRFVYEINMVNAAAWLITRDCLRTVGLFDPLFTHYGEDNDYVQRTFFHNFSVGIVFDCQIYHDREDRESRTFKQLLNFNFVNTLFKLKNINILFHKCLLNYFIFFILKILNNLFSLNYNLFIIEIYNFIRILFLIPQIYISRIISKSKNCAYFSN